MKINATKIAPPVHIPFAKIEFEFTREELQAFCCVLNRIGGHPDKSHRGMFDNMTQELMNRNLWDSSQPLCVNDGRIFFKNFSEIVKEKGCR